MYASRSRSKTPARPSKYYKKSRAIIKRSYAKSLASAKGVGLANSLQTQLKTVIFFNAVGAAGTGVWTGNLKTGSCFDPTGSLSTIQPAEFDQWSALFGRYVVTGGSVKVTVMPLQNVALGMNFVACMYPDIDATAKADYQAAASQDWSVKGIGGQGMRPVVLYQKFSHAALLGKKGPVTSEDNGALVTSDPTATQFINHNLFIQSSTADPAGTQWTIHVEIIQDVYFDRRVTVDTE